MKQKFGVHSFVRVIDDMPETMDHFPCGFDAIVKGTYSQLYGGKNINNYSVYQIEDGVIVDRVSWYQEELLIALPDQDINKANDMVEAYNLKE